MAAHRLQLTARGLVQGVGFRPFVYRLATDLGLGGFVLNHAAGVTIEVEGPPETLVEFSDILVEKLPAPGYIDRITRAELPPRGETSFRIASSHGEGGEASWVLPDLATCDACLAELLDPADRRHGYPFLNCTHCGPRFTIVRDLPYDRGNTTMAGFPLCKECRCEYEDPLDRRFHAQPTACAVCGPRTSMALDEAAARLCDGQILAVKGLGGYHLAVDATDEAAVGRLRERKHREAKPLAVMVADLAAARALAVVSAAEAELLTSPAAPIVLLAPRPDSPLAPAVAPGQLTLGVMLAYTPLHHVLLRAVGRPLVMTSGNLTDEPIAHRDDDAAARLTAIADAVLSHDRPIERRCDDSVVRVWRERLLPIRRSRGYAPLPLALAEGGSGSMPASVSSRAPATARADTLPAPPVILACGAHQKNTFCLVRRDEAFLSHHLGDLENDLALAAYEQGIADFERLFELRPSVLAHDLHPDYLATRYAVARAAREGLRLVGVQHHHAHVAACLADNGRHDSVLGVAFDGTGYGPDGTVWGGELLLADRAGYERVGCLRPFQLPGGEAAVRQGWRVAVELARQAERELAVPDVDQARLEAVRAMSQRGFHCVSTTSAGRLFDGFATLCGLAAVSRYEGEAAILLEGAAGGAASGLPFAVDDSGPLWQLDWRPAVCAVLDANDSPAELALAFHRGLAAGTAALCDRLRERTGCGVVALSGGCFQNVTFLSLLADLLQSQGFEVLTHRRVPPNDGGLSLGQAAVARAQPR